MTEADATTGQETPARTSRRQFLGAVGGGVAASVGAVGVAGASGTPTVSVENNRFDPLGLFVEPGTTVSFEFVEGSHSATAYPDRVPDGAEAFDSGVLSAGTFEHTFDEPGTYDYYCTPHKSMGMAGRIVVGAPGGPAEDGPNPDADLPDGDRIVEAERVTAGDESGDSSQQMGGGHGGMMDGGPMDGSGLQLLVPAGFATGLAGLLAGAAFWLDRRGADKE